MITVEQFMDINVPKKEGFLIRQIAYRTTQSRYGSQSSSRRAFGEV